MTGRDVDAGKLVTAPRVLPAAPAGVEAAGAVPAGLVSQRVLVAAGEDVPGPRVTAPAADEPVPPEPAGLEVTAPCMVVIMGADVIGERGVVVAGVGVVEGLGDELVDVPPPRDPVIIGEEVIGPRVIGVDPEEPAGACVVVVEAGRLAEGYVLAGAG